MSKNEKLKGLSLNKKTITRLNDSQMKQVNGGVETGPSLHSSLSCSNYICDFFSVGPRC